MAQDKHKRSSADPSKTVKKRYQRPEILYREPLEAMAALCTPSPPAKTDVGTCAGGPLRS